MVAKGQRGGARPNAGRKSKAVEMGLVALLDKCWTIRDRETCIRKLARSASDPLCNERMDAAKLLMSYAFGKPKEKVEHGGEGGGPITVKVIYETKKPYEG